MRVTVVLAVYNGARSISAAIESVRQQTFTSWELVVVDDASVDSTPQILTALSTNDERIRVIRNQANRGLAASLNIGWRAAHGELIARLDADDLCAPDRLERQVHFMLAHPEIDVLGGAVLYVYPDGSRSGPVLRRETHAELSANMYRETPFFHPTVMMRRRFLEDTKGYDERIRYGQDSDLWLRSYQRFTFHNLPEVLVYYRVTDRSSLSRIGWGMYVLFRAAIRERKLGSKGIHAVWFGFVGILHWLGLRRKGR